MKARSYRGVVEPRYVALRKIKSKTNNVAQTRGSDIDVEVSEDILIGESNYIDAFNDEKWPEMWYLVSI